MIFANKGESFLEFKREQLMNELEKSWFSYQPEKEKLKALLKKAFITLNQTYKEMGKRDLVLISNISKIQYNPTVDIKYEKKLGYHVPHISLDLNRDNKLPAYSFEDSSHFLDDLIQILEQFFRELVNLAEREDQLFKIVINFKNINRRINGLNNRVIPRLKSDIKNIKESLEEADRQNFVRLKKTKELITKKKNHK